LDQRENLRSAILKCKARLSQIENVLQRPLPTHRDGQRFKVSEDSLLRLHEEKQKLDFKITELEAAMERAMPNDLSRHRRNAACSQNCRGEVSASHDEWESFAKEFEKLMQKELALSADGPRGCLHAHVTFEGTSDMGFWSVSGPSTELTDKFKLLACRAALALRPANGTKPLDHWLRSLYLDLLDQKQKSGKFDELMFATADHQDGIINRLTASSAKYCTRLAVRSINVEASSEAQKPSALHDASKAYSGNDLFRYSDDYRSITFQGEHYVLTPHQALIIQQLHEALLSGIRALSKQMLLSRLGNPSSRLRDSFKTGDGLRLWGKLIVKVKGKHDMYRLNLSNERH